MPLSAEKVRASAKAIFEAAFPPCGYATEESLKNMAAMVSSEAVSFDCPLGGDQTNRRISFPVVQG